MASLSADGADVLLSWVTRGHVDASDRFSIGDARLSIGNGHTGEGCGDGMEEEGERGDNDSEWVQQTRSYG